MIDFKDSAIHQLQDLKGSMYSIKPNEQIKHLNHQQKYKFISNIHTLKQMEINKIQIQQHQQVLQQGLRRPKTLSSNYSSRHRKISSQLRAFENVPMAESQVSPITQEQIKTKHFQMNKQSTLSNRKMKIQKIENELKKFQQKQKDSLKQMLVIKQQIDQLKNAVNKLNINNQVNNSAIFKQKTKTTFPKPTSGIALPVQFIKIDNFRKQQLIKNKGILFKNKYLQIGYLLILSEYMITISLYVMCYQQTTYFRLNVKSHQLLFVEHSSISCQNIEANLQKRYDFAFQYPHKFPFLTPQLHGSYHIQSIQHSFTVLLPCITMSFTNCLSHNIPNIRPFYYTYPLAKGQVLTLPNLKQIFPGIQQFQSIAFSQKYGIKVILRNQHEIYIVINIHGQNFNIEIIKLNGNNPESFIKSYVQQLISILGK